MDQAGSTNILTEDSQPPHASTISVVSVRCRICYDNEKPEELMAPCQCKGTMAFVHRSCLETWLGESGLTYCELCNQTFKTERILKYSSTKSIWNWFKYGSRHPGRCLRGDVLACGIINPLTVMITYICLYSSEYYDQQRFSSTSKWTALCLLLVIGILFFGYYLWVNMVVRTHSLVWYSWWQRSCIVSYIAPSTISLNSRTEDQAHVPNNSLFYHRSFSRTEVLDCSKCDLFATVVIHSEALTEDESLNNDSPSNSQDPIRNKVKDEGNDALTTVMNKTLLDGDLINNTSSDSQGSIRIGVLAGTENDSLTTVINFDALSEGKYVIRKQENATLIEYKMVQTCNNIYSYFQDSTRTNGVGCSETNYSSKPVTLGASSEGTIQPENEIRIDVEQSCSSSNELNLE